MVLPFLAPLVAAATSGLTSLGLSAGLASALVGGAINIGASVLFSTVAGLFLPKGPSQQQIKLDLGRPTSKPAYRFVYGKDLAIGTPAPVRVRGSKIFGCWILNSRPSDLTGMKLFIDKREMAFTGDWSDFTDGGGASVNSGQLSGLVKFWIGDGSQTTPPFDITDQAPRGTGPDDELFDTADGWQGRTVLWAILDVGPNNEIADNWFSTPPLMEVFASWSKVWDPRDVAQDADDESTWTFSENHALICLDAARFNKIRPFTLANLNLQQFIDAANAADEFVTLKSGGSERRYTIGGTVVWDNDELWSKLGALYSAGAANPTGDSGILGIAPGVYEAPSYTMTDFLTRDWEYQTLRPGDKITQLRTTYTSADRFYEPATLEPYDIPGALTAAGGVPRHRDLNLEFAGSATQAMRVQKIEGERIRREITLTMTAPPSAANLIGGSTMTVALPSPFDRMNGLYQVVSIDPQAMAGTLQGGGVVSLACPFVATEYSAEIFAWNGATEEQDLLDATFNPETDRSRTVLDVPTNLTAAESGTTAGTILISAKAPRGFQVRQLEFSTSTTANFADATILTTISAVQLTTYEVSEIVGSGQTRYYWVRALGDFGLASDYAGPVSATTA